MQQEKYQERNSNFELLRSIAMFMIVIWHVITHGGLLNNSSPTLNLVLTFILYVCIIHVNTFMLITGYYQYDKKFRLKKFIKIYLQLIFYNVGIYTLLYVTGIYKPPISDLLILTFIFNCPYWYLNQYLFFYLLSPYINKLILFLNKKEHLNLIFLTSFLYFVMPYISFGKYLFNNGFNIQQFFILYLIGSYINKYKINPFNKKTIFKQRLYWLLIVIACIFINMISLYGFRYIFGSILKIEFIINFINDCYLGYSNPVVVIQTIATFMLFKTFNIKSSFINDIAKTTFGIYLIHENKYLRTQFYKFLAVDKGIAFGGILILVKLIYFSIIVFFTCALIEKIRIKFIENTKWYNKIIEKIEKIIYKIIPEG